MNLVAPFGFYGAGNIGDESTLQGFARLVSCYPRKLRISIASCNPRHTARVEPAFLYHRAQGWDPRRWLAGRRATALAVVGGTPIMDTQGHWPLSELEPLIASGHASGRPLVFIGSGTERLRNPESIDIVADRIAPNVRHWTVRSDRDRERLIAYGVRADAVTVAADLAWHLEPVSRAFGADLLRRLGVDLRQRLVGVNLTSERFVVSRRSGLFERIAAFLDLIVERHDVRVLFLANEVRDDDAFDTAASRKTLAHMKHAASAVVVPSRYWTPQQMMSLIALCDVTLSMRYHFVLFSALQGVPCLAIQRSDKVEDLCADLHWPYALGLDDLSTAGLVDLFAELQSRRDAALVALEQRVGLLRQRSATNAMALDALMAPAVLQCS